MHGCVAAGSMIALLAVVGALCLALAARAEADDSPAAAPAGAQVVTPW